MRQAKAEQAPVRKTTLHERIEMLTRRPASAGRKGRGSAAKATNKKTPKRAVTASATADSLASIATRPRPPKTVPEPVVHPAAAAPAGSEPDSASPRTELDETIDALESLSDDTTPPGAQRRLWVPLSAAVGAGSAVSRFYHPSLAALVDDMEAS